MSEVSREAEEEQGRSSKQDGPPTAHLRGSAAIEARPATRNAVGTPPGRGKTEPGQGLQRTASAIRTVVPLLQKVLPLLDGNVASAVANLLAPRLLSPPVDLSPLEISLTKLRGELTAVRDKNAQHDGAFKRIDDQLDTLKDSLERTSLEQKDVAEELRKVRRSVLVLALFGVALLLVSIGLNAVVFLFVSGKLH